MRLGGGDDLLALGDTGRQRLFAQDVFASLARRAR